MMRQVRAKLRITVIYICFEDSATDVRVFVIPPVSQGARSTGSRIAGAERDSGIVRHGRIREACVRQGLLYGYPTPEEHGGHVEDQTGAYSVEIW